jgi:hypothetical protein
MLLPVLNNRNPYRPPKKLSSVYSLMYPFHSPLGGHVSDRSPVVVSRVCVSAEGVRVRSEHEIPLFVGSELRYEFGRLSFASAPALLAAAGVAD